MKKYIFLFFLQCLNTNYCQSQQETQKRLEKEKAILVKEIKQINSILFSNNNIKKYFGPLFLFASAIIAAILIKNKPTAETKEIVKDVPFVKTMILKSQTVNARISSQGFIRPKSELNILSELNVFFIYDVLIAEIEEKKMEGQRKGEPQE